MASVVNKGDIKKFPINDLIGIGLDSLFCRRPIGLLYVAKHAAIFADLTFSISTDLFAGGVLVENRAVSVFYTDGKCSIPVFAFRL